MVAFGLLAKYMNCHCCRIAINDGMIQNELGIDDSAHRKKLELRAMDVVLFGPPRGLDTFLLYF